MELSKIIKDTNFEFKKKFGQNFISDTNLLQAICDDAMLCSTDEVLEIGVGGGTLTKQIAKNVKKVLTDQDVFAIISKRFRQGTQGRNHQEKICRELKKVLDKTWPLC